QHIAEAIAIEVADLRYGNTRVVGYRRAREPEAIATVEGTQVDVCSESAALPEHHVRGSGRAACAVRADQEIGNPVAVYVAGARHGDSGGVARRTSQPHPIGPIDHAEIDDRIEAGSGHAGVDLQGRLPGRRGTRAVAREGAESIDEVALEDPRIRRLHRVTRVAGDA